MQLIDLIRRAAQRFKRVRPGAEDKTALGVLYFTTALQYHVCARYAAFAGFMPVCGNLFHHAVEMYLKGYLCDSWNEHERRSLGHNLKKIWRKVKAIDSDPILNRFDDLVVALQRWEEIRYPEKIAREGMIGYIHFSKPPVSKKPSSPRLSEPRYEVVVDELDALSKIIFEKRMNPKAFIGGLKSDAQDFLKRANKSVMW